MRVNTGIGKSGVVIAAILALAMCLVSFIFKPVSVTPVEYGICLDSPDYWNIDPFLSWIINTSIIGLITLLLYLINKSFNFVRTPEPVLPVVFLIMACSCPWFTQSLNTSTLLCLVNIVAMGISFGTYQIKNATQPLFTLGVMLGIGSMFQYAFLPLGCIYLIWALFMKVLRFKELIAFFMGLLCPYWIALGFGIIHFKDFHFPSLIPFFGITHDHSDLLFLLSGIGLAIIIGVITALSNSMKLYAGNSRVNSMNLCATILGLGMIICILVDYENIPAYVLTLYMSTAIQIANIPALWNVKYKWVVTVLPSSLFLILFIGNLIL